MAKCEICDKTTMSGHKVSISRSHVSRRANHKQKPNIKKVRIIENGAVKSINICTRCLRAHKVTKAF